MCGIAGIIHYNKSEKVNESLLTLCRDTLLHRGIDDGANYIHQNVGLAHRRLSIIDLTESGHQPMISEDGNYIVVYNGEIYNYVALREMLLAKGVHFKSSSDTEVLLQMYIHFGKNMLHQLSGMFAFAIWDNIKEELF
jgi:asparagine synthase (glutamine-hydrolysing)